MIVQQAHVIGASAFLLLTFPCEAGLCSRDIVRVQTDIDAKLNKLAATEPFEQQSTEAQMHRQPTLGSMAEMDKRLRSLSASVFEQVKDAIDRARKADDAGDKTV
jgi:hypothetical protein